MTKEARKQNKAVEKIRKAIRKAVDKGVSQSVVESTVDAAIIKAAKKAPAKKSAALENSDPDAEPVTSKPPTPKLKKLPGKHTPPTSPLKRGGRGKST
jgi:hypothetical protein